MTAAERQARRRARVAAQAAAEAADQATGLARLRARVAELEAAQAKTGQTSPSRQHRSTLVPLAEYQALKRQHDFLRSERDRLATDIAQIRAYAPGILAEAREWADRN